MEGEYISDWDNCIVYGDGVYDNGYTASRSYYKRKKRKKKHNKGERDKAGRKKALSSDIENRREENKLKKKGELCICPMCNREFIKSTYQQVFDCPECHNRYHTLRYK